MTETKKNNLRQEIIFLTQFLEEIYERPETWDDKDVRARILSLDYEISLIKEILVDGSPVQLAYEAGLLD